MTMSSIRAILTVGTIVLAVTVLHSQAAGQATPSSIDPSAVANRNATFFGYTGFIGDELPDATIPEEAVSQEPATAGLIRHVQGETQSLLVASKAPSKDDKAGCDESGCGGDKKGGRVDCVSCYGPFRDPWVTVEYMHAWARGRWLPPLVTTSPPGVNGVLPTAAVLFGDEYVGTRLQASGRLSFGAWLDDEESIGVGGRIFALEGDSTGYAAASDAAGNPLIARPFYNTDPIFNAPDALIVTAGGLRTGDLLATADNDVLGVDAYLRYSVLRTATRRVDLLAGYHFTGIADSLNVNHRMQQIGGVIPVGTQFEFEDVFDVYNEFHGAELGLLSEFDRGPFTLSLMGKLSMGNMRETLTIFGRSSRTPPAGVATNFTGGLLALPTNMGTYTKDDFAIIPEAEFKLTCRITERLEASIGYSFMFWSDIAMAGQQVDMSVANMPTVNASQLMGGGLVGPANPAFGGIQDTDFWIHALSIGFTLEL